MNTDFKHSKKWAWINILFYVATLAVNYLGASGLINGMSQKDISDKYITLITPAPFTFSIWGVIYTLLLASIIWMILKSNQSKMAVFIRLFSPVFWVSCILNAIWIIAFSYEQLGLSVLFIFGILIALIKIYQYINQVADYSGKMLIAITFSIYSGWVTIATVVNIAAFLVQISWLGFGIAHSTWTVIILIVALVIVSYIAYSLKSVVYPLAIAWAYFGIYVAHQTGHLLNARHFNIKMTLTIGIVYLILLSFYLYRLNGFKLLYRVQRN